MIKFFSLCATTFILLSAPLTSQADPQSDVAACLGVGLLSKQAGEFRDSGLEPIKIQEAMIGEIIKNTGSSEEKAKLIAVFPTALATQYKELNPWSLHSLGTKICAMRKKANLSPKTIHALAEYAFFCQRSYKTSEEASECMAEVDKVFAQLLSDNDRSK